MLGIFWPASAKPKKVRTGIHPTSPPEYRYLLYYTDLLEELEKA